MLSSVPSTFLLVASIRLPPLEALAPWLAVRGGPLQSAATGAAARVALREAARLPEGGAAFVYLDLADRSQAATAAALHAFWPKVRAKKDTLARAFGASFSQDPR
jgi:hypothetical protein